MNAEEFSPIVDWTNRTTNWNNRVQLLVLHHTVTATAEGTLDVLNARELSVHYIADRDGVIYRMVDEQHRAYHAGVSAWGERRNLNDVSIGIEIVNSGAEPFPDVQVKAVAHLSRAIVDRWEIKAQNIVAHGDIAPDRKNDPSGYFDWKLFYNQAGIFPHLFESNLTDSEQRRVLLEAADNNKSAQVTEMQNKLLKYGYRTNAFSANGIFDNATQVVVEAFNRHFCPEVFIKEEVVASNTVNNPVNKRWYGISEERLNFLLAAI